MTEGQIKHMVNRFLGWTLPNDFSPDAGISFKKIGAHQPTGTNVFDAIQADAMVRHMIEAMPDEDGGYGHYLRAEAAEERYRLLRETLIDALGPQANDLISLVVK
jgi:hypothetical protein